MAMTIAEDEGGCIGGIGVKVLSIDRDMTSRPVWVPTQMDRRQGRETIRVVGLNCDRLS